jgi:hypothetical protein
LVPDYFEQGGKKKLCSQRIVGSLHKICFLTCSIENFYFSSICNLYRDDFPLAPPGSYFNLGNNSAWVSHHQKLSTYFLKFPSQQVLRKNQLWKDLENTIDFIYFLGKLQQCSLDYFKVLPKLQLIRYHSCQFQLGCYKATHHGYHRAILEGTPKWTLFQETSLTFLKSLKIHLFYVERVLMTVSWREWEQIRKQVPRNFGFFGTIWIAVVHNPSYSQWHYDPKDFGLVALLYFGEFSGGELELGSPFSKTLSLQNFDLVLLNSSKVYHHSHPFQENRVNLIFYLFYFIAI